MINKLISKSQVRLLEFDGYPSRDYAEGYCRAINDVLDLEPIPTLGVDEIEQIKAEIETEKWCDKDTRMVKNCNASGLEVALKIIDNHISRK